MKKCFKALFFVACCLVKILQIPVFLAGLLWELEVVQLKKTPVFTGHVKFLVEKTLQKNVFSTHSLKNHVNSRGLDEFCP